MKPLSEINATSRRTTLITEINHMVNPVLSKSYKYLSKVKYAIVSFKALLTLNLCYFIENEMM